MWEMVEQRTERGITALPSIALVASQDEHDRSTCEQWELFAANPPH